ncbi:MAG: 2-dehydropantoate 2-reductase [Pseudomonadota bacterium]
MYQPKILIQGAGSVGGVVGGRLLAAGYDVTFVTGNEQIAQAINSNGLRVLDRRGETKLQAPAFTAVKDLPAGQKFDVIFLAMMDQSSVESIKQSISLSATGAVVVTFQNGLVIDAISAVCGAERLIPSTLAFGMTMEGAGIYRLTTEGAIIIGELDGSTSPRLQKLQTLLESVATTKLSANIVGVLWGKLLWNSSVSALCAITGRKLGDVCGDPQTQAVIIQAFREAVETAEAHEVTLEKVVVDHHTMYVPEGTSETPARELLSSFTERYAAVVPSTAQSLQKGKLTEIEYLNGYVATKAREIGQRATMQERLTQLVHEIEQGARQISPSNLDNLIRA